MTGTRGTATAASPSSLGSSLASLPLDELNVLHKHFGGDSSIRENRPMMQRAPSGGTISALSVQVPALLKLMPYMQRKDASAFDLGFGSGVMAAMLLAVGDPSSSVIGVDLEDKVPVAMRNLRYSGKDVPFLPFAEERYSFIGGDAMEQLAVWEKDGTKFDVVYAGCSLNPDTDQLRLFLQALKPDGAAVFNLGLPGRQAMYFVADSGRVCEQLMLVNFMMCESSNTPADPNARIPLEVDKVGAWIRKHVFEDVETEEL